MGAMIVDASDVANRTLVEAFWITERDPLSQSSLTTNAICRVVFALLSNLLMWVPLKLLRRHGELAAVILIIVTMVYNVLTLINAIIWHTDDVSSWWMGWVYCDAFNYINYPILTIYTSCVFAIMRNLADQTSLMRADSLSLREKHRRNLVQALIIFPAPVVQLAWMYPTSVHRYYLMPLAGCTWWPSRTWPSLVFFCIPQPAFTIGAAWYAGMSSASSMLRSRDGLSGGLADSYHANKGAYQSSRSGGSDSSPKTPCRRSPPPTPARPPAPAAPSVVSTS